MWTSSSSRTWSRRQSSRSRRTPRSATTSGVVTTTTLVGDLGADRARLGDLGAEVDDGQRVARADRVEHGAGDAGVDLLRALALLGREQHAEALAVRVERLLQVADRDLRRDLDEVDDAAPVREVEERAQVALLEVEVDDADRPAGHGAGRGERELERDGRRADAALGAGDGDQPAAEPAGGRLLPGDALAQRARPLGRGADAGLELLERQRERDDVAQARPASPRAAGPASRRRRSGRGPVSGNAWPSSRARSSTGVAPSASCSTTTSTSWRRSARVTSSGSSTTATTSRPSPSCASAAALEATSRSAIASSSRWLTVGHRVGLALVGALLARQLLLVAGAQQREPDLGRLGLRVGDEQRLLGREREGDGDDLLRVGGLLLHAAAALQPRLADLDDARAGNDDARLGGLGLGRRGRWRSRRRSSPARSCRRRRSRRRRGSRARAGPGRAAAAP